jgi:hypothetical protein
LFVALCCDHEDDHAAAVIFCATPSVFLSDSVCSPGYVYMCVFLAPRALAFSTPGSHGKGLVCVLAPSVYVCVRMNFALLQHQNLILQSITPREINSGRFGGRVLFLNYADRVSKFIAARA